MPCALPSVYKEECALLHFLLPNLPQDVPMAKAHLAEKGILGNTFQLSKTDKVPTALEAAVTDMGPWAAWWPQCSPVAPHLALCMPTFMGASSTQVPGLPART